MNFRFVFGTIALLLGLLCTTPASAQTTQTCPASFIYFDGACRDLSWIKSTLVEPGFSLVLANGDNKILGPNMPGTSGQSIIVVSKSQDGRGRVDQIVITDTSAGYTIGGYELVQREKSRIFVNDLGNLIIEQQLVRPVYQPMQGAFFWHELDSARIAIQDLTLGYDDNTIGATICADDQLCSPSLYSFVDPTWYQSEADAHCQNHAELIGDVAWAYCTGFLFGQMAGLTIGAAILAGPVTLAAGPKLVTALGAEAIAAASFVCPEVEEFVENLAEELLGCFDEPNEPGEDTHGGVFNPGDGDGSDTGNTTCQEESDSDVYWHTGSQCCGAIQTMTCTGTPNADGSCAIDLQACTTTLSGTNCSSDINVDECSQLADDIAVFELDATLMP